jgi:hypothetical protein
MSDAAEREPWTEGPDEEAPPESWLVLDDDELLHRVQTCEEGEETDDRLVEVVESHRHFFLRQEAAKRVKDRTRLFDFEDDRHVGQILVRHLNRREDVTYLERLSARSRHVEVRSAAQVQLARLWQRLDAPRAPAPAPPPAPAVGPAPGPARAKEPVTSAAVETGGVDGSLLGWAAHFVVEQPWSRLGTTTTLELLQASRRDLLDRHPSLVFFEVSDDAHVSVNLEGGLRLPAEAVAAAAAWLSAFRAGARQAAPDLEMPSVRALTALVADALRDAGFYAAFDEAEARLG